MSGKKRERDPDAVYLWKSLAEETDVFIGFLVIAALILAVAGFLVYVNYGAYDLYASAKYKLDVEAELVDIKAVEKEQEVLDDAYKDAPPAEREKHTKTEKYILYVLTWKYYVDDVKQTYTETDKYLTVHKVGDMKRLQLYSNDGVEYKRASHSVLTNAILIVSAAVCLVVLYGVVRVVLARIMLAVGKKKKRRRRSKS